MYVGPGSVKSANEMVWKYGSVKAALEGFMAGWSNPQEPCYWGKGNMWAAQVAYAIVNYEEKDASKDV